MTFTCPAFTYTVLCSTPRLRSASKNGPFQNPNKVYIDITSVAGGQDSVYIRFEFYSPTSLGLGAGCGYSWMIDDVMLSDILADDAYIMPANGGEYSWIPSTQLEAFQFRGRFHNWGYQPITGARILFTMYDNTGTVVMTDTSAASGTINPEDTSAYLLGSSSFMPVADSVEHTLTQQILYALDGEYSNDTSSIRIEYNDSTYARDLASLGYATFNGGYGIQGGTVSFGQMYHVWNASDFTSANFYLSGPTIGDHVTVDVYSVVGGVPDAIMGSSANYTISYDDSLAGWINLPFSNPVSVTAGDYCIVLNQLDTNFITLALSTEIFTPQKSWFLLPAGSWTPIENANIVGAFLLQVNNPSGTILAAKPLPANVQFNVYPNPSKGIIYVQANDEKDVKVEVTNSLGQVVKFVNFEKLTNNQIDLSSNPAGVYNVRVTSAKGEMTKTVVLQ